MELKYQKGRNNLVINYLYIIRFLKKKKFIKLIAISRKYAADFYMSILQSLVLFVKLLDIFLFYT